MDRYTWRYVLEDPSKDYAVEKKKKKREKKKKEGGRTGGGGGGRGRGLAGISLHAIHHGLCQGREKYGN